MLLCPSHVIHVTVEEEMYCAGVIKVGRGFIAHDVRLEQSLLCKWHSTVLHTKPIFERFVLYLPTLCTSTCTMALIA